MQRYKAPNGEFWELEPRQIAEGLESRLPPGSRPISDEEYFRGLEALRLASITPDSVRADRDALLARCDWTQLGDVPEATRQKWVAYRQALRDITKQKGFPSSVDWPVAPV